MRLNEHTTIEDINCSRPDCKSSGLPTSQCVPPPFPVVWLSISEMEKLLLWSDHRNASLLQYHQSVEIQPCGQNVVELLLLALHSSDYATQSPSVFLSWCLLKFMADDCPIMCCFSDPECYMFPQLTRWMLLLLLSGWTRTIIILVRNLMHKKKFAVGVCHAVCRILYTCPNGSHAAD